MRQEASILLRKNRPGRFYFVHKIIFMQDF